MTSGQRRVKALQRDWRYALVVSLGLAIPAYVLAGLTVWAVVAHVTATVLFLAGLFFFGRSYALMDIAPVLLVVIVLALVGRAYHSWREHEQIQEKIQEQHRELHRPVVH